MKPATKLWAFGLATAAFLGVPPAVAEVTIPYNEYSSSPTIGRGNGSSTDPDNPGYGAMRIFIEKVIDYTDELGPDALPPGQKVVFRGAPATGREVNALRAGIQFANRNAAEKALVAEPTWGFIFNSLPFGLRFEQMMDFLYDAKIAGFDGNGLALAQALLDRRGGTQIVLPVIGSTMQGSGYFPQPIGAPDCRAGDAECLKQGSGIGLAGLCRSGWRIRYLAPPQHILDRACDTLVQRGVITAKTLTFYPAVGGQSVLLPMQRGTIQGFEFVTPADDLVDFFPIKQASAATPLGKPDAGPLDCGPALPFPLPAGTTSSCTQNIGQLGARYAHHPAWHQPFLLSWIHIDKALWNSLNAAQQAAIRRAAKDATLASYAATESVQCKRMQAMLDINQGVNQRQFDGSLRLVDGQPVSAAMTLAVWPDEALKALKEAADDYLASLAGPADAATKTEPQQDFAQVATALQKYAEGIGASRFEPGKFPAKTGLIKGSECGLVK